MQCPKCHTPLVGLDYQGVHIETCPACHGDWLDAAEFSNILKARQNRFTPQECQAAAAAEKISGVMLVTLNRHFPCPNCNTPTNPINYGDDTGLIIDKCPQCHGLWVDAGELDKIEELIQGWDANLPADLAQYGPKLRQVAATEKQFEYVRPTHHRHIDAAINGILDLVGE